MRDKDHPSDNKGVLTKVAGILDAFGSPPHQYTCTEVHLQTGISKASIHRLMGQLVNVDFLEKSSSGKTYRLGRRLIRLLHFNLDEDVLNLVFRPELQAVADRLAEASFAARLSGSSVELFEVRGPSAENSSFIHPGIGVRPIHVCSSAKCILAFQDEEDIARLLDANLTSISGFPNADRKSVEKELLYIRRLGFAVCDEELEEAVYSVACPILFDDAHVIYSIGIVAPKSRISESRLERILEELKTASAHIANSLGAKASAAE